MNYSPENAATILKIVQDQMEGDKPANERLEMVWRVLISLRSMALSKGLQASIGMNVHGGPFKGMALTQEAINLYRACVLLGSYEQELHPVVEKIIAGGYTRILNIGCSIGYYAVGLALRMPHTIIEAFDIDPEARAHCAQLAALNNVSDRVRISGEFAGNDFAAYADGKTFVLMDIEGAEMTLLDPAASPALQKMDVLVELHDAFIPNASQTVSQRFTASHDIDIIKNVNSLPNLSGIIPDSLYIPPIDHLLLGWERRDGATPWGVFWHKNQ